MSTSVKKNNPKIKKVSQNELPLKILDKIIYYSIILSVIIIPFVYIPSVPSPFDLNKQLFLIIFTSIGFLAWFGKMSVGNQVKFKKEFILIPLLTFLIIYGFSAWFSYYREVSIWGDFGGQHFSLITLLTLVVFFILTFNNINNEDRLLNIVWVIVISGFFVCLFGILQYFEIYLLPFESLKDPFFNSIGSFYMLGVYSGVLFLLCISLLTQDKIYVSMRLILLTLALFFFFIIAVVNLKVVYVALIFCLSLFFGAQTIKNEKNSNSVIQFILMLFLVFCVLFIIRNQPLISRNSLVEISLNHSTSFSIALQSFLKEPLLGVGPGNYSDIFRLFRPDDLGSFWSNDFPKASSYFLTLISTTGILGMLSFLFLTGYGVYYLFRNIALINKNQKVLDNSFLFLAFGGMWLFLTVVLFGYSLNMTLIFLWWLSLALFTALSSILISDKRKNVINAKTNPRTSLVFSFVFVLVIIGFISLNYTFVQKYVAAYYYNKALVVNARGESLEKAGEYMNKAIAMNPKKDIYYSDMSNILFALANKRAMEKKEDLNTEDSTYISQMVKGSLNYSEAAIDLNSNNSKNYQNQARIYEGIIGILEGAAEDAVELYEKAIEIDPRNPLLYHKIANINVINFDVLMVKHLNQLKQQQSGEPGSQVDIPDEIKKYLYLAKENVNKALAIKEDFMDSNLLLVEIYEREGDLSMAIEQAKKNKEYSNHHPRVIFKLGLLYYKMNRLDEAKGEFSYAVSIDPDYSNARYFLGLILDKQANHEEAIEQFEVIKKLNPENEEVAKILDNLQNGREALFGIEEASKFYEQGEQINALEDESGDDVNLDLQSDQLPKEAIQEDIILDDSGNEVTEDED
ncbi:MAG: tetratricopeptide repeat protein [Candidatus Moranbacteria bacterium]|nr:tetratricopeptide repeat protein [Candidatus Moranbacteria bacterium]